MKLKFIFTYVKCLTKNAFEAATTACCFLLLFVFNFKMRAVVKQMTVETNDHIHCPL